MDMDDARAGMADIEARQAQAVREAASWRWPRWYLAATAALMVGISVAMDFGQYPAMLIVVYCCGVSLLQIPLAARMRVRLHRSRNTLRVNWPLPCGWPVAARSAGWLPAAASVECRKGYGGSRKTSSAPRTP